MLQCDKQTFVSFPKHAEIVELILAGKTEPETEPGMRSDAGRLRFFILPLCADQLYCLHQIFHPLNLSLSICVSDLLGVLEGFVNYTNVN